MKNSFSNIAVVCFLSFLYLTSFSQSYVSLKGKKFMLNNNDFYPIVLNYGVDIVWDGSTGHYIAPHHGTSCNSVLYTCGSASACSTQVWNDLYQIKQMGFNAIRLVGLTALKLDLSPNCPVNCTNYTSGLSVYVFKSDLSFAGWENVAQTGACNPSGITQATLINLISQVLSIASDPSINLKVILIAGGGNVCQQSSRNDLKNYFSTLASTFSTNTALMAYDLYNEPGGADGSNFNKQTVCTMVADWYDAIKANDANHLVTIGFTDATTLGEWDPGALKLDFASFHPYPFIRPINPPTPSGISDGFNRVLGQIYWTANNINAPWMLGETGFLGSNATNSTCSPNASALYANSREGNEADQRNYVQQTIDKTRDCRGSGYSYWWFQDTHDNANYNDLTGLVYTDGNHTAGNYVLQDAYYGQFGSYNPIPQNSCSQPASYLLQHPEGTSNHVDGYVKDNSNNPIKDAVVWGWSFDWSQVVTNFTDPNGHFDLYTCSTCSTIYHVRASAVGSNVVTNDGFLSGNTIILNFTQQHKNTILGLVTILYPSVIVQETYNNIYNNAGSSYIVDGNGIIGGDVTFKAGGEIDLRDGFWARRGSAFRAFYGIPVPNCSDAAYSVAPDNPESYAKTLPQSSSQYYLLNSFGNPIQKKDSSLNTVSSVFVSIYPNPTSNGKADIFISDISTISKIVITDVFGRTVQNFSVIGNNNKIDLEENPKGIYFIKLNGKEKSIVKKLIYQ